MLYLYNEIYSVREAQWRGSWLTKFPSRILTLFCFVSFAIDIVNNHIESKKVQCPFLQLLMIINKFCLGDFDHRKSTWSSVKILFVWLFLQIEFEQSTYCKFDNQLESLMWTLKTQNKQTHPFRKFQSSAVQLQQYLGWKQTESHSGLSLNIYLRYQFIEVHDTYDINDKYDVNNM